MIEPIDLRKDALTRRELAVAMAVTSRVMDFFKSDLPQWDRHKANALVDLIQTQTVLAMRQERKMHAADMAYLAKWQSDRLREVMLQMPQPIVVKPDGE